jgi:hypothetical protein
MYLKSDLWHFLQLAFSTKQRGIFNSLIPPPTTFSDDAHVYNVVKIIHIINP